jgi:hypothetical protein
MTDYVSKPISWTLLIAAIERVLQVSAFHPDRAESGVETLACDGPPVDAAAAAQLTDFVAALDLTA